MCGTEREIYKDVMIQDKKNNIYTNEVTNNLK